jgi:glycolate oxidase iron-sulfur subunit
MSRNIFAELGAGGDAEFERYLVELQKCMRCGQCRTNCPVFRSYGAETDVARGKLAMLAHYLRPEETPDRELYGRLTRCVNCGRCRLECPSGTDTGYALLEGRQRLLRRVGMPPVKAMAVRGLFGHYGRLRAAAAALRMVQPLAFRARPADPRHVRSIWRLPVIGQRVLLPRLRGRAKPPQAAAGAGVSTGKAREPRRVVVYPGCLVDLAYPELLASLIKLAGQMGYEVTVPRGLVCCGAPAAYAGDLETARRLAAANLKAVLPLLRGGRGDGAGGQPAPLLFLCPSCAVAFGHDYPEYLFGKLSGSADARQRHGLAESDVRAVAARAVDAAAWAWRHGAQELMAAGALAEPVTYHDPCHLRRLLGVVEEPRSTLRHLAGRGYREAPDADACCGFGGTFAMEHVAASGAMVERRARELAGTGASVVATACPGCMAWLANGLDRVGAAARPVHVIELMSDAVGAASGVAAAGR